MNTQTFYTVHVVVYSDEPWNQACDGKLYTKKQADTYVKEFKPTVLFGCKPTQLKAITLGDFIDEVRRNTLSEGAENERKSHFED